jgi:type III secretory pathway component EscU
MDMSAHARRLGLFAWIYAALVVLSSISGLIFLKTFLGDLPFTFLEWSWDDFLNDLRSPYSVMFIVFVVYIVLSAFFNIGTIVANLRMGFKLRGVRPPARKLINISSIFSLISSVLGGIFLLPFGTALCIYGLWFANNKAGREYLANR